MARTPRPENNPLDGDSPWCAGRPERRLYHDDVASSLAEENLLVQYKRSLCYGQARRNTKRRSSSSNVFET
jgi:hypothetical protein